MKVYSSPPKAKRATHLSLLRTTIRAKSTPINFNILFEKYFLKEEDKINLKKYLIELYHDLSHFSSKEENGISYETFIYFLNMPNPISSNIFKLLDKDKNNFLNLEEFVFGLYDIYGTNSLKQLTNFVFNLFDTDKDGLVSKEEIHLLLSYIPLERNLRQKFLNKDYYNISYNEIAKNQKLIEQTLNNIYHSKNYLNLENFNYTIQKVNSDILVAILIYLFESRPFDNEVLKIYSNTNYDYFHENKNHENFNNIEKLFEKKEKKNNKISLIKQDLNLLESQNIEEPRIDFIHDLGGIKNAIRFNQKKFTLSKESLFDAKKRNKSNKNILFLNNKNKPKGRKTRTSSYLSEIKLPKDYFNKDYKKLSSENLLNIKDINTQEKSLLNVSDLLKLNNTYESTVFKITNTGKLKSYYLKLIKKDLFYFKSKDNKFHIGMHHLTNDIILMKNKKQKYKDILFFSLSIINQEKTHTFYFDNEDIFIQWYKHLQKAVLYRRLDDIFILGDKIKSDKIQIVRNIRYKENRSHFYNNNIIHNSFAEEKEKKYLCIQIIKAGNKLSKKLNESIFNQISAFEICYHKNFRKLIDIFRDEKYFYIITEKQSNEKNVLDYLRNLDIHNPFKEEEKICEIIHQLLISVYYLHKMGIMHRNIKPDNIIPNPISESNHDYFSSSDSKESQISQTYDDNNNDINNNVNDINVFSNIKLVDLSLSKFLNVNEKVKEPYGTVGYLSPELLSDQTYDFLIDEWSIGIVTHLLLCGKLPFSDEYSEREIARQTIHEKLKFEQPKWEKISKEAKDFVIKLLIKDPKKRMKAKNALVHPWIKKYYPLIVEKRMKNVNDNTTNDESYEFESFSSPIDKYKD